MKFNKLIIKNICISSFIFVIFFLHLWSYYFSFDKGIFIKGIYLPYLNVFSGFLVLILFAYIIYTKYDLVLNSERFNTSTFHMVLNILMLYILTPIILMITNNINIWIGMIVTIVQLVYFLIFIYNKGLHEVITINPNLIQLLTIILGLLLITSSLNNLPFIFFNISLPTILIVLYVIILFYNLYNAYKTFFQ